MAIVTTGETVGRVAVVTGGSSGIGEAVARELYARGDRVAIVSRDARRGEEVARALGPRAVHLAADLTAPEQIRALPERVERALGRVSVLVNNAGIYRQGDAATTSEETWQEIMRREPGRPFPAGEGVPPAPRPPPPAGARWSTSPRRPACAPSGTSSPTTSPRRR